MQYFFANMDGRNSYFACQQDIQFDVICSRLMTVTKLLNTNIGVST